MSKEQSFESYMKRLQEIVAELEKADLPLEKNVALYKEGRKISAICAKLLEKAEHEISICTEKGEEPFNPDSRETISMNQDA